MMAQQAAVSKDLSLRLTLLSFVATLMVVFIHVPKPAERGLGHFLECGICEIAVPFFFVVSGFFIARHVGESSWWRRESVKRFKSLLVPYLIWCLAAAVVYMGMYAAVNVVKHAPLTRNFETFTVMHVLGLDLTNRPVAGPLWYVRELLLLLLPLPVLSRIMCCSRRLPGVVFLVACLAAQVVGTYWIAAVPTYGEFFRYCLSPRAVLFYSAGLWLAWHPIRMNVRMGVVCFVAGLGLLVVRTLTLDLPFCQVIWFKTLFWMVSVIVFLVGVWALSPAWRLPGLFVGVSFPLYLMHDTLIHPLGVLLVKVGLWPGYSESALGVAAVWAFTVCACIGLVCCFRRFLPRVASVAFGGR